MNAMLKTLLASASLVSLLTTAPALAQRPIDNLPAQPRQNGPRPDDTDQRPDDRTQADARYSGSAYGRPTYNPAPRPANTYNQPGYGRPTPPNYPPNYRPGYGRTNAFDYDRYQRELQIDRLDAIVGLFRGQERELRRLDAYFDREFQHAPRNPNVYQRLQYDKMQAVLAILTPVQRDRLFAHQYYSQYQSWDQHNYGPGYGNRGYAAPRYGDNY